MPKKRKATFYVEEDGSLHPPQKAKWLREQIQLFAGGRLKITLERPKRSLKQNAYLWGIVYKAVHKGFYEAGITSLHMMGPGGELVEIPLTVNTIHWWMKHKYLSPEAPGKPPTTTSLDSTAFSDYIEKIRQDEDVIQCGIYIPEPGEDYELIHA